MNLADPGHKKTRLGAVAKHDTETGPKIPHLTEGTRMHSTAHRARITPHCAWRRSVPCVLEHISATAIHICRDIQGRPSSLDRDVDFWQAGGEAMRGELDLFSWLVKFADVEQLVTVLQRIRRTMGGYKGQW